LQRKYIIKKQKKKTMWTYVNFSNLWTGSLNQKHPIWKNYKTQFLNNQILKSEIEKRILIIQNDLKQKITIKRMMIKIKIKEKFYFWLKSEIEKKNQIYKKNQKSKDQN
jgi:hypothetical protein